MAYGDPTQGAAVLAKLFGQGGGGSDQLQLRSLQDQRLGELEDQIAADSASPVHDPVSAASILRRGLFKKQLESDMASAPDTGDVAHQEVADITKQNQAADAFNDPRQADMRHSQEQFKLREDMLQHPNPNVMPYGSGMGSGGPESPLPSNGGGPNLSGSVYAPKGVDPERWAQYSQGLPPDELAKLSGLLDYSLQVPSGNVLGRPEYSKLTGLAKLIDPTYDSKLFDTRKAYMKDYATGKTGSAITSLDTVMHHLDSFQNSADALHNTGSPVWNALGNWMKENTTGFPEKKAFDDAAEAVTGELSNVFKATGATDQEIRAWRGHLAASETNDEFKANTSALVNLINGRMQAVGNRYKSVMGKDAPDFLSPESRQIFDRYKGGSTLAAPQQQQQQAPMGGPASSGAVTVKRVR